MTADSPCFHRLSLASTNSLRILLASTDFPCFHRQLAGNTKIHQYIFSREIRGDRRPSAIEIYSSSKFHISASFNSSSNPSPRSRQEEEQRLGSSSASQLVEAESFWAMRNDLRRERKLPGFFDREVYDILDGASPAVAVDWRRVEEDGDGEEVVFDSGRTAAEDGLFSDFEEEKEAEEEDESVPPADLERLPPPVVAVPISEKKMESFQKEGSTPGPSKDEQQGAAENSCKDSPDREGRKRRRTSQDTDEVSTILLSQLIEMLDRNNRMLTAQLEAQNINSQLDREQRKDQADGLLGVLNKLADALGRIADKL